MKKSDKILFISNIILVGFFLAVVFHYILGFYMGQGYSFNTFLSEPYRAFDDFTALLPKIKSFEPYAPPADWQNYFPLAYLILMPFAYISNSIGAYLIFLLGFISCFCFLNYKNFLCRDFSKLENFQNIFIMTFLSYPLLCLVDRGNFDMVVLLLFAGFAHFLQKKDYLKSAVLLGLINALKPFSFLFVLIFLFDKKYKEFFLSLGISFALIFGGFLIFKGNFFDQINVMLQSFVWAKRFFILNIENGVSNSSSLFMGLKFVFCSLNNLISVQSLLELYKYIAWILTLITIVFAWREKIFWKRICILTLFSLTVPHMVFDYKLILLFVPMWLFINEEKGSTFDLVYAIIFALLLIPKRYLLFFDISSGVNLLLFSTIANPLLMLTFTGLIIYEQLFKREEK